MNVNDVREHQKIFTVLLKERYVYFDLLRKVNQSLLRFGFSFASLLLSSRLTTFSAPSQEKKH